MNTITFEIRVWLQLILRPFRKKIRLSVKEKLMTSSENIWREFSANLKQFILRRISDRDEI